MPPVALHPADYPLWRMQGGAPLFGMRIDPRPEPTVELKPGMVMRLGPVTFEVRHTPGHTPGHVIFYCPQAGIAFCGDVIFRNSIGRTDLPGGSHAALLNSIQSQVLSLPDDTKLYSGHGEVTTVGEERIGNPFLS
jgi:glyoxylase-like metal-dependent hydrolase (beta-lactamase superfamily II)